MKKVTKSIALTGEIIEFDPKTPGELVEAYRVCSETIKTYEHMKKQLASFSLDLIGEAGTSEAINGYMFRNSFIQRQNYDKAVLRDVLDADTYDLFMVPDKAGIDQYLKENLETLGDASTAIRKAMVPVGKPYSVTKLEKL